jgi:hypothetical protein
MRFPFQLNTRAGEFARGFALVAFGVVILLGACDDKHIGRPCQTGAAPPDAGASGGAFATVSSPVLACPSRICLDPGDQKGDATNFHDGAFCTATCSSDDDCSDAEIGNKGDTSDTRCKSSFVCGVATTVGPFCCQKLCICRDFVVVPPGGLPLPMSCMPSMSTCQNVAQ